MKPSPVVPKVTLADSGPLLDQSGNALPPIDTVYLFDQLIDHSDPSKGTFKQRYWHTWEWYKPGGPIIITTPGEGNADGKSELYLPWWRNFVDISPQATKGTSRM